MYAETPTWRTAERKRRASLPGRCPQCVQGRWLHAVAKNFRSPDELCLTLPARAHYQLGHPFWSRNRERNMSSRKRPRYALKLAVSFELKSPHGLAQFAVQQQQWLGIDLHCITQDISAKKSWQSFASDQATVSVILRQGGGGFCEPRKRINTPLARTRYDAGFSMYIPSHAMPRFGDSAIPQILSAICALAFSCPLSKPCWEINLTGRNGVNQSF